MAETFVTFCLWSISAAAPLPQFCQAVLCENHSHMQQWVWLAGMWPSQADCTSRLLEQGLAVIDLKAVMPECLGSAGRSPDGFCTSGIHLFNGFVQWPTAAKLTDQSTKMQGCDCQLFRGRKIALKGFMGRASSPSSSGSYSSCLWYNVREKEQEKTCLCQTLAPRCNRRCCHPAQQQVLFFSVLTLGQKTWGWTVVQNLAYAEKGWEQCKPHGKQTYSCSLAERMKVNCNYTKPIFPLSPSCHIVWLQKEALKKTKKLCLETSFMSVPTSHCTDYSQLVSQEQKEVPRRQNNKQKVTGEILA